jgi:ABC-type amino acid transport substrate-binding protein
MKPIVLAAAAAATLAIAAPAVAQDAASMTFFITSAGPGDGANLGGLEGADAHCQQLAEAAGSTGKTWVAYLSADEGPVNAKDRIGTGPWQNFKGDVIATDVANLHSDNNNLNKQTGLTETGQMVKGRGDQPNEHDILTGSNADGTLAAGQTCGDWTSNGEGSAIVGHFDRVGIDDSAPMKSWVSSHPSRGCSQENLVGTGGAGLLYCFAKN